MNNQNIYESGKYLENNACWHEGDSAWKAEQILLMLKKNGLEPKSVCEIGCGAGEILNQLYGNLSEEIEYHGYEISPQAYALCEKRKKDRLNFHLANLLEDANAHFDLGMAIDVIEHVEDYFSFLRAFRKKADFKMFHIPLAVSAQTAMRGQSLVEAWDKVGHIHIFTRETALAGLKHCGYEIIDYRLTCGAAELATNSVKRKIAKIPRKLLFKMNRELAAKLLGGCSILVLSR
jgi:SAM-dependent methyltransferase